MQINKIGIIVEIALQYKRMTMFERSLMTAGLILGEVYSAAMVQPELIAKISETHTDEDTIQDIMDYCIDQTKNENDYSFMVESFLSGNRNFPVNILQ